MQPLPGFRDFYPDDCARRNYIFALWRDVARRFGFVEVDGPILESTELYRKKSGGELVGQLYQFTDKGERDISLRPEMTPTVARMIASRHRDFKKPVKWFSIGQFFRFERPQKGRLREFYQLNCDIFGEAGAAADAELIALSIELLRGLGFGSSHFMVRLSTRNVWSDFLSQNGGDTARLAEFLNVIDKMERESEDTLANRLKGFGVSLERVREFMAQDRFEAIEPVVRDLEMRGLGDFVKVDAAIVRGLAYYTGTVFELFDRSMKARALAGGGRYDDLVKKLSDENADLPAVGFGMGDVVLADLIDETEAAAKVRQQWILEKTSVDLYAVIASEEVRGNALRHVEKLRNAGLRVELPLSSGVKVGKQFQAAEQCGARYAAVFGAEYPKVKLKFLATRQEQEVEADELITRVCALP